MHDKILLSHGEGGKRTRDLIAKVIARYFDNPVLAPFLDAGLLGRIDGEIAFTTDGYVVTPPFFPGGDIGRLAVCGTVNDLAVCGAKAVAISCGLILEEGLPLSSLERALSAMRDAAKEAGRKAVFARRDKAADLGTRAHAFVEAYFAGEQTIVSLTD